MNFRLMIYFRNFNLILNTYHKVAQLSGTEQNFNEIIRKSILRASANFPCTHTLIDKLSKEYENSYIFSSGTFSVLNAKFQQHQKTCFDIFLFLRNRTMYTFRAFTILVF